MNNDTLIHNGPMFPEKYKKHNVPLLYNNKKIILPEKAELYASLFSKYINTEYYKDSIFKQNFFNSWKENTFTDELKKTITDINKCDFSLIYKYVSNNKIIKYDNTKESLYKYAYINGKQYELINYKIEPTLIFIGRGCHKLRGTVKDQLLPDAIILNISKDTEITSKYNWKDKIYNNNFTWTAAWKDPITKKMKYTFILDFVIKREKHKYDRTRLLHKYIKKIRSLYIKYLRSDKIKKIQKGIILYFLDKLALRIGSAETENTYGITTLLVKHIRFYPNYYIKLKFVGKDSIEYNNKIKIDPLVYNKLKELVKNKKQDEFIFDKVTSKTINNTLKHKISHNISSKDFRTYNASVLFYNVLNKLKLTDNLDYNILLIKEAYYKVSLLCNHQRKLTKNIELQLTKLKIKLNKTKDPIKYKLIKKKIEILKNFNHLNISTAKINYIDPRIIVAFSKKNNIPINKIFSKSELKKFKWALEVNKDWKYI